MRYYVDASAAFPGKGSEKEPFRTISQAAAIARPGDEVIVAPGVYRETVSPANGGTADARIVYRAACPGKAVITGAEEVKNWESLGGEGGVRTDRYYDPLPVYAAGNVYFNGARPWRGEESPDVDAQNRITLELKADGEGVYLASNLGDFLPEGGMLVDTAALGKAFEPDQAYENPDGTPIVFDTDYFGEKSGKAPIPGPFADKADYKGEKRL